METLFKVLWTELYWIWLFGLYGAKLMLAPEASAEAAWKEDLKPSL